MEWPVDREIEVVEGRRGQIALYELREPAAFLAVARGVITLPMIRRDIEVAAAFGRDHPESWCYLADVRSVRLLDPRNLLALRRVPTLPGLRHYVVVAPRWMARLSGLARGDITASVADALARCRDA